MKDKTYLYELFIINTGNYGNINFVLDYQHIISYIVEKEFLLIKTTKEFTLRKAFNRTTDTILSG